jgi:hypothetical protein
MIRNIQKDFEEQATYYYKSIKLLTQKNVGFKACLDSLTQGEDIENKELDEAFQRKKKKNKYFNENNPENKVIWLNKHIKSNDQDIEYLGAMDDYAHINSHKDCIKEALEREPKIYIYDVNKGLLKNISQEDVVERLGEISLLKRAGQIISSTNAFQLIKKYPIQSAVF